VFPAAPRLALTTAASPCKGTDASSPFQKRNSVCALQAYRAHCKQLVQPADAALAALMSFLVLYIEPVRVADRRRRRSRRTAALVASVAAAALGVWRLGRRA
jgi:hypothetical protein